MGAVEKPCWLGPEYYFSRMLLMRASRRSLHAVAPKHCLVQMDVLIRRMRFMVCQPQSGCGKHWPAILLPHDSCSGRSRYSRDDLHTVSSHQCGIFEPDAMLVVTFERLPWCMLPEPRLPAHSQERVRWAYLLINHLRGRQNMLSYVVKSWFANAQR